MRNVLGWISLWLSVGLLLLICGEIVFRYPCNHGAGFYCYLYPVCGLLVILFVQGFLFKWSKIGICVSLLCLMLILCSDWFNVYVDYNTWIKRGMPDWGHPTFLMCEEIKPSITWRRDIAPIQKRIPVLSSCTNMLWHGEIITKDSFMSPAGPSSYRVCCFVPSASRYISSLPSGGNSVASDATASNLPLESFEKAMLKSEYGIDLATDIWLINEKLNNELLQSPYWGQCVFFVSKDVLCIICMENDVDSMDYENTRGLSPRNHLGTVPVESETRNQKPETRNSQTFKHSHFRLVSGAWKC